MYADSLVCDTAFELAATISENDNLRPFTLSNYDLKNIWLPNSFSATTPREYITGSLPKRTTRKMLIKCATYVMKTFVLVSGEN